MEHTYQYEWIIPFVPLPVPIAIGVGLLLVPTTTKNLRRFWAFLSVLLLKFGDLIDPLTSIMLMLITTAGIMVLIYSDNYMSHDEGYLRFFAYMSFSNTSMLGLVTSSDLIQIYIFWELVGMCSYLLIGFWFTRPIAANACQKAFVTNRVGDFGLLLGILGLYWITGSFEFRDLFKIVTNFIENNGLNSLFLTLCAALLFLGAVAKSAQFPLHVWLPDAMEGGGAYPYFSSYTRCYYGSSGNFSCSSTLPSFHNYTLHNEPYFFDRYYNSTFRSHFGPCPKRH
ncbi:hypothetical protein C5167_001031 [Papaver somniferum]|uniref:NADH:quinone oxidoreductase/Mrp antiporter membrane subunit domain-containing protein n=1 Tax=Papaver somniferum TaxID=3469 RepID=A0A4Y7KU63_PAPSO|nr:hypothetical protein C5167_001031 [Papaver somniferum]